MEPGSCETGAAIVVVVPTSCGCSTVCCVAVLGTSVALDGGSPLGVYDRATIGSGPVHQNELWDKRQKTKERYISYVKEPPISA